MQVASLSLCGVVALRLIRSATSAVPNITNNTDTQRNQLHKTIQLLPHETNLCLMEHLAVNTVTFFRGEPTQAAELLKSRVQQIVAANPWLAGRLTSKHASGIVHLEYEPDASSEGLFKYDSTIAIGRHMRYASIAPAAASCFVPKGNLAVDKDVPLFMVIVVPDVKSPAEHFAVVTSMNHVLGDGHTQFGVYNMLSIASPIEALNPERHLNFTAAVVELMGLPEANMNTNPPTGLLLNMLSGIIVNKLAGLKTDSCVFELNQDWVARQKQQSPIRVSTNDIIISGFLRAIDADVGMFAADLRTHTGVGTKCAGNYQNTIQLLPADWARPERVRASVNQMKRASHPEPLPSFWGYLTSFYGTSTNWSSFTKGFMIYKCTPTPEEMYLH